MYNYVHSSIIHTSPKLETIQVFQMVEYIIELWHIHKEYYLAMKTSGQMIYVSGMNLINITLNKKVSYATIYYAIPFIFS